MCPNTSENYCTNLVSSMVAATKHNGTIRLCLDPKPLNQALKRNLYPLSTIDDLLLGLSTAKVFSVVDAKNGFWMKPAVFSPPSLHLGVAIAGMCMPFGISPASEEFQRRMEHALQGLPGVRPIIDDILIYGSGDTLEQATQDRDAKILAFLQCYREQGIKFNEDKLKLSLPEVVFMGHIIVINFA